jgi:hypothetical protein
MSECESCRLVSIGKVVPSLCYECLKVERGILRKALETLHVRSQKMSPLDSAWVEDVCWDALEDKR